MRKREDHPLSRRTINYYEGDYEKLQSLYPRLGAGKATRDIIRAHLKMIEAAAAQRAPLRNDLEAELEIDS